SVVAAYALGVKVNRRLKRSHRCCNLALCACMAPLLSVTPARAGGPLGKNGEPIATSRYSIDFYQGPVSAGSRVVGLGGAYVAVAEDVDGNLQNPAAPAVRPFYSVDHFDWWPGFSISFPADIENLDFFNSGSRTAVGGDAEGWVFATPALNLQGGNFGVGATAELQNYGFSRSEEHTPERQ